ncbi:unnamed protein product [Rhizoctonia solani]|uniref:Uncharacterized protein n=1 Tax=Rhizoctonia solani TaxID=456999 RepID=A0A8H3A5D5_9AGAM|nr:unnamed protein product [Rhizoctonia solani]
MDGDTSGVQHSRKLIVYLYALVDYMIERAQNNRPQLVYKRQLPYIAKSSRSSRLAVRAGLKKNRKSSIDDTVAEAHTFLLHNYEPGDEVVLRIDPYLEKYEASLINTVGNLARHLHDGTHPSGLSSIRSGNGSDSPVRHIPIHCIVVLSCARKESVAKWNDELKSRFPPGIEHIISWTYAGDISQSCSTYFHTDGSMVSRKLCFFQGAFSSPEVFFHATQHVIYFKQNQVSGLDQRKPAWARLISSSPSTDQDTFPSESTKPVGMYHHELRKYDLPSKGREGAGDPRSILVWKSSCR